MPSVFRKLISCLGGEEKNGEEDVKLNAHVNKEAVKPAKPSAREHSATVQASAGQTIGSKPASSERQHSESDATQETSKPQSVGSTTKVDSNRDVITPVMRPSHASDASVRPESDPDKIAPVNDQQGQYGNVANALEDRRKLFERLRRPNAATSPVPDTTVEPEQEAAEPAKLDGG